jgi:hypothetical protein
LNHAKESAGPLFNIRNLDDDGVSAVEGADKKIVPPFIGKMNYRLNL